VNIRATLWVEAGRKAGGGHLVRSSALVRALMSSGVDARLALSAEAAHLYRNLLGGLPTVEVPEGVEPSGALALMRREGVTGREWIVLDGYGFGAEHRRAVRRAGHLLLVIDDLDVLPGDADVILNQNPGAEATHPPDAGNAILLRGPGFALLRPEFILEEGSFPIIPNKASKTLVLFGASDPNGLSRKAVAAFARPETADLRGSLVLGPGIPDQVVIMREAENVERLSVLSAPSDLPQVMGKSEMALTAAGSTCLELCSLGIPFLMVRAAENQRGISQALACHGAGRLIGDVSDVTSEVIARELSILSADRAAREAMSLAGRSLVDGRGAQRVAQLMLLLADPANRMKAHLRPAREEDARAIFDIANDPAVRAASFSSDPIPWEDHLCWYAGMLASDRVLFLVLDVAGMVAGQIRFERRNGGHLVSFSLAGPFRGRGLGAPLLVAACELAREMRGVDSVTGMVRPDNVASAVCFRKAGFRGGLEKSRLVFTRSWP